MNKFYNYFNIKDLTKLFLNEDVDELSKFATISYIGFLFLIELFIFVVLSILNSIFVMIIGHTPLFISLTNFICYLLIVVLMLVSIVNTINGKSIRLPLIGKYKFIK